MTNEMKNLMFDLAYGKEIYDAEADRIVSKDEANATLSKFAREELGLNEFSTHRDIKRALESEKGRQLFQVIEEVVDQTVNTGWRKNEFFNNFVEMKNMADGDKNEFWIEKDIILSVEKVSGSNHDLD